MSTNYTPPADGGAATPPVATPAAPPAPAPPAAATPPPAPATPVETPEFGSTLDEFRAFRSAETAPPAVESPAVPGSAADAAPNPAATEPASAAAEPSLEEILNFDPFASVATIPGDEEIDAIDNLAQVREHTKALAKDLRAFEDIRALTSELGSVDLVKHGAQFRRNWLDPDPSNAVDLYNELYDANPDKLAAVVELSAQVSPDFLSQKLFGMTADEVRAAITSAKSGGASQSSILDDGDDLLYADPGASSQSALPPEVEQRLAALEAENQRFRAAEQQSRQQQQAEATRTAQQQFISDLEQHGTALLDKVNFGEHGYLRDAVVRNARAEVRKSAGRLFEAASEAVKSQNKVALAETLPALQRAFFQQVREQVRGISHLLNAESELARMRRGEVASEGRIDGGAAPALAPPNNPAASGVEISNDFGAISDEWKNFRALQR